MRQHQQDNFDRIIYEAMLDDSQWHVTSGLIDEPAGSPETNWCSSVAMLVATRVAARLRLDPRVTRRRAVNTCAGRDLRLHSLIEMQRACESGGAQPYSEIMYGTEITGVDYLRSFGCRLRRA